MARCEVPGPVRGIVIRSAVDPPVNAVIIVSGLPRSGTSMLMAMLSAGGVELITDGVRAPDEDNPRGYYEFELVKGLDKGGDTAWLERARGKAVKIISQLLPHLPATHHYKIIFVRRDLTEVLASQKKMLERRGEAVGQASDQDMARWFTRHLDQLDAQLAARANCAVLYVEHRDVLRAPAEVAERIDRFLDMGLNVTKMSQVVDQQLYRNRV